MIFAGANRATMPASLPRNADNAGVDFDKVKHSSSKALKQGLKVLLTLAAFAAIVVGAIGLKAVIVMSRFNYFN
jgi:hypothetical protein